MSPEQRETPGANGGSDANGGGLFCFDFDDTTCACCSGRPADFMVTHCWRCFSPVCAICLAAQADAVTDHRTAWLLDLIDGRPIRLDRWLGIVAETTATVERVDAWLRGSS